MEILNSEEITLEGIEKEIEALYKDEAFISLQEITYAYSNSENGGKFNETLFGDFAGLGNKDKIGELSVKTKKKLLEKIEEINFLMKKLTQLLVKTEDGTGIKSEKIKIKFILEALEYTKKTLEFVFAGVDFEIEKFDNRQILYGKNREKALERVSELDEELFGKRIINTPEETEKCIEYIASFWGDFSEEDKKFFQSYVDEISRITGIEFNLEEIYNNKNNTSEDNLTDKFKRQQEILETKVPQEKYLEIFSLVLQIYGLENEVEIRASSSRSSIYDGPGFLEFPTSKQYQKLTIKRILELIAHEVERHILAFKANKNNLGNIEGANKLGLEEGVAMLMEKIVGGEKIDNISVSEVFPRILFFEIFDGFKAEEIAQKLGKYDKLEWGRDRTYRAKRNYPFESPGTQHKDTTYTRGLLETIQYIKDGKRLDSLYLGRVGFSSISDLEFLYGQGDLENESEKKSMYPIFVAEAIRYILLETDRYGVGDEILECSNFLVYLKNRYPFIDLDERYRCLIENSGHKINKKIIEILDLIGLEKR